MARYGVTFRLASRLLDKRTAEAIFDLYAFCRLADDLVDVHGGPGAQRELDALQGELARGEARSPLVARVLERLPADSVGRQALGEFVRTMRQDLGPVRLQTVDDLVRYAYGAAGTVGLMFCDVVGVRDRAAWPAAIDLGIAMQLTNIARDVLEDACNDRRYLPTELLGHDAPAAALRGECPVDRTAVSDATLAVLQLARRYYVSGDRGLAYLPWRARLAAYGASRMYEGIGTKLARGGAVWWHGRTSLGVFGKLLRIAVAVASQPGPLLQGRPPRAGHDASLHRCLAGLPGANPPR
ncbi:MAG: phytoene/squalene synthase family protein [Planctomycetota bacterium]